MSDQRTGQLQEGLLRIEERIAAACERSGRPREQVQLVVVTKFFPADDLARLLTLGVRDFGESRDQEATEKLAAFDASDRARFRVHFIGQLQSKKARHVAMYADLVHSVDRDKLLAPLGAGATQRGILLPVLIQVDLAGDDAARGGVGPAEAPALADAVARTEGLHLAGVMTVAPRDVDPAAAFARLAGVATRIRADHPAAQLISAGMSGDLEQAVDAGATHLRVGSAILGNRPLRR